MTFFYDFNVKPDIDVIKTLDKFNFKGACVFYNAKEVDENTHDKFEKLQNLTSMDLYYGIYVDEENPQTLRNQVLKNYRKCDIIMVAGGKSAKLNHYTCKIREVDMIDHPYDLRGNGINHILSRMLVENNITVNINLMDIIKNRGTYRTRTLSQIHNILKMREKFNFRLVFSTGSENFFDVRSPEAMLSLGRLLNIQQDDMTKLISNNVEDVIGNIEMRENSVIEGVRILK